jgi:hypothetical protein
MKTLFETYVEEFSDNQYCGYCMTLKTPNCCDHSYYVEFKDLTPPAQLKIINQELDQNQRS